MMKTAVSILGKHFLINGAPVYAEVPAANPAAHGLLMNARFIQGIFDDAADGSRFARFGKDVFDPEAHTDALIAALPEWYAYGLRAFTVGFQGGGPCFTTDNQTIENNPFGTAGRTLDPAYAQRMDRLIRAADELGMVVICSFFYGDQTRWLQDDEAVRNAVRTACAFLREGGYTNVLVEIANEHDLSCFKHEVLRSTPGIVELIQLAQQALPGVAVGCSGCGGYFNREEAEAADLILIHGNGLSRQRFYRMIRTVQSWGLDKPIICNEDSQAIGNLSVAFKEGVSWGYYNNMTKQEPPADWSITPGEDAFFAERMAELIGLNKLPLMKNAFYLQGFEPHVEGNGKRWIRLASRHPEQIDCVEFYCDGMLVERCYDEPFSIGFRDNWLQEATEVQSGQEWSVKIIFAGEREPVVLKQVCP